MFAQTLQIIGVSLGHDLGITHQQQSFKIPENGRYDLYWMVSPLPSMRVGASIVLIVLLFQGGSNEPSARP